MSEAQDKEKQVELQEVEVKSAKVVVKPDGKTIYPSAAQVSHSANVYGLLAMLPLNGLRVNVTGKTIDVVAADGGLQIRINGVRATKGDLQSLDVATIRSVEFTDNAGVRYGDGIKYVINIVTRRKKGYQLGAEATNAATTREGDNSAYAKMNSGNSQWGAYYDFGYMDYRHNDYLERADYSLHDGSVETVERRKHDGRSRNFSHDVQLSYSIADTLGNVVQASVESQFSHSPLQPNSISITGPYNQIATQSSRSRTFSPVLNLYGSKHFGSQTLTADVTATYIHSRDFSAYDEGSPYNYWDRGKVYSIFADAVYEYRMRPFTFSAGINYQQRFTDNLYTGDVESGSKMIMGQVYAFTQLAGRLWHFSYVVGLGYNNLHYRQGQESYDRHFLRPKFSLKWSLTHMLSLSYSLEMSQWISRVAMLSDTRIRKNAREWIVGNPNLKQPKRIEHTLKLDYSSTAVYNSLMAYYRRNPHANMALYTREDDQFYYTQTNQRGINVLALSDYLQWNLIPDKLTVSASAAFYRDYNYGDTYKHHYSSFSTGATVQCFLGRWTLTAMGDNGFRWLEGESKGKQPATCSFSVMYQTGNWNFWLSGDNLFNAHRVSMESELISRQLHKLMQSSTADTCNKLSVGISWKLSRGKHFSEAKRRLKKHVETDTGLLK